MIIKSATFKYMRRNNEHISNIFSIILAEICFKELLFL